MRTAVLWIVLISSVTAFFAGSSLAAKKPCNVSLPQHVDQSSCCHDLRHQQLLKNQMTYRLITQKDIPFALVDLTGEQLKRIMALESFAGPLALSYQNMTKNVFMVLKDFLKKELGLEKVKSMPECQEDFFNTMGIIEKLLRLFRTIEGLADFLNTLNSFEEFAEIRNFFIDGLQQRGLSYPSRTESFQPINWTLIECDDFFAQQRLAGANPMTLQSVRTRGGVGGVDWYDLRRTLNPKIQDLDKELGENDRMYVLRYPLCDELPKQLLDITNVDFTLKKEDTRSPIALFVSDTNKDGELRPVAIQMDNTPDSDVFTPKDSDADWMAAKLNVQTTDIIYSQMVEHLVKVHFISEVLCVALRRHLPDLHPLQQIMKFHCREVMVPNVLGIPTLLNPITSFTSLLFGTGVKGAKLLIDRAYGYTTWDVTDFWGNIQDRGLEHEPHYFPYRDDGKMIFDAIEKMVTEYVDKYYGSDGDVENDTELQAFANEVSADGKDPPDGGDGKLRGFPTTITTREQLTEILTRIIFHVTGQHASVNYELNDYVAFVPNMPFKTYKRTKDNDSSFAVLPNKATATIQVVFTMGLSSLRYDKLFDYGHQLSDKDGRRIVKRHFKSLRTISKDLKLENNKRKAAGQLTYPYMLPEWLPNGIQT